MSLIDSAHDLILKNVRQVKVKPKNSAQNLVFNAHRYRLIYNTCWEDPRIDRQLLKLDGKSKVVMITSAGCNALDYLLDSPAEIHTVDVNLHQNALLQLKLSLYERGYFPDLFAMFGLGFHPDYRKVYASLKHYLPAAVGALWDAKIYYFDPTHFKRSFYYHGASGDVAWLLGQYLQVNKGMTAYIYKLLEAQNLDEQKEIYAKIEPELWNAFIWWLVKHSASLVLLGVPWSQIHHSQIQLIEREYPHGLAGYVRDSLRRVMTEVPMQDNYFWRVYLTGSYTPACCPNYLKIENFNLLQANINRIHPHTCALTEFLRRHPGPYTHFVLLDHQDWLIWHNPKALREEWQLILANSRPGSKILIRSASKNIASLLPQTVKSSVQFFPELTDPLHGQDRVGTYGSLHLAEVL